MSEKAYAFYQALGYPLPHPKEFFAYQKETTALVARDQELPTWQMDEQMHEYVQKIRHWQWIWRRIPFVEKVYVGNSLTFNGLREQSDIDLFVVTAPQRLRIVRFRTNALFLLLGIKRFRSIRKQFCLSFYVTTESMDLLSVKQDKQDPYLVYRIAHLVEIYSSFDSLQLSIREENKRIKRYLPNFPMHQVISLDIQPSIGESLLRHWSERLLGKRRGNLVEGLIRMIRVPLLVRKKRRLGKKGEDIIISDSMLKFHADQRKKYSLLRKLLQKDADHNTPLFSKSQPSD